MKNILIIPLIALLFVCCSSRAKTADTQKPTMLWFDAKANFNRFSSQDSICHYLDLAKKTGFNEIVVDVRPTEGDAMYKSKILEPLTTFGDGYVCERNWDYLQFFIDEARKREMKVTVSAAILTAGQTRRKSGTAYHDSSFDDKLGVSYSPDGVLNAKDTRDFALTLNPVLSSVQDFVLGYVTEIVSNYDFDAFTLDYCRYLGPSYDFSDSTRVAFEQFVGEKIERFPEDIFTFDADGERVAGKYYKQWWEFRSSVITHLITRIRQTIKEIKPDMKLSYWAASWLHAIYGNGQNWGSKHHYDPSKTNPEWASETYKNTGFADQLDIFLLGSYLTDVYGLDNNESIEYAIMRAYRDIGEECPIYGTLYGESNRHNMEDAVYVCLTQSSGLMVFDIVQVINYDLWGDIKRGIERAEIENSRK